MNDVIDGVIDVVIGCGSVVVIDCVITINCDIVIGGVRGGVVVIGGVIAIADVIYGVIYCVNYGVMYAVIVNGGVRAHAGVIYCVVVIHGVLDGGWFDCRCSVCYALWCG